MPQLAVFLLIYGIGWLLLVSFVSLSLYSHWLLKVFSFLLIGRHFFLKIYSIVVVYSYIKDLCRDPIPPGNNGQQELPRAISTAKLPSRTHLPSGTSSGFSSSDRRKPKSSGNYVSIVSMLRKLLNQIR